MDAFRNRLLYGGLFSPSSASVRIPILGPTRPNDFSLEVVSPDVSLAKDERGLVISAPITIVGTSITTGGGLDAQELRFSLLFWDKLDWPDNTVISIGSGGDAQFLEAEGILTRSFAKLVGGGDGAAIVREAFLSTFRHRDSLQPGLWSLARGERTLSFDEEELDAGRGLLFRLHRAIPIPDRDVALNDVLEFKLKRRDELNALRHNLEDVYQRMKSAPDEALSQATEFGRLDKALSDYLRVIQKSGMITRSASVTVKLDLKDAIIGVGTVQQVHAQGLDLTTSMIAGAVASAVAATATVSVGVGLRGRKPTSPFEYVSEIHERLF